MRASRTEQAANYVVLVVISLVVLWPAVTFVLAALSSDRAGRPGGVHWDNFVTAWEQADFSRAMTVSITIAV
ncbi:MAG: carbohydrate ABC transporter permease, partial [Actinobacteria bacterium]|nr:carbohydrate ABC transporter permease [Actinomycetota bacterium]